MYSSFSNLIERNAGYDIWLAEDATGLVPKIQYDSTSNHLIGIVLPFDENGIPKMYESTAANADEIKKFMQHTKSTLVYIVLAIPIKQGIPPFMLQMFGTDNRFKSSDIILRWTHTVLELQK